MVMGKLNQQKIRGVSNLRFFCMMHIYKIVGIFQFFHYGQCRYSISVDTWKTRDPNFGGGRVVNLKIFCTMYIYKIAAIFQFFHNG